MTAAFLRDSYDRTANHDSMRGPGVPIALDRDPLLTSFKLGLLYSTTQGCTGILQQKLERHRSLITILGQGGEGQEVPRLTTSLCCKPREMPTSPIFFLAWPRMADRTSPSQTRLLPLSSKERRGSTDPFRKREEKNKHDGNLNN